MLNDRFKELLIAIGIAAVVMVGISIKKSGSFFNSQAPNTVQGSKVQLSLIRSISLSTPPNHVTWSSDGLLMAAIYDIGTKISVWDNNGHLLRTIERREGQAGYYGRIEFMPGSHLIVGPPQSGQSDQRLSALALWNADTGELVRTISGPMGKNARAGFARARDLQLSPDGTLLAMQPIQTT